MVLPGGSHPGIEASRGLVWHRFIYDGIAAIH